MISDVPEVADAVIETLAAELSNEAELAAEHFSCSTNLPGEKIDIELKILESALLRFQTKVRHRQAKLRQQQNCVTSPIYRLPIEILGNIAIISTIGDYHTSGQLDFDYRTRRHLLLVSSGFFEVVISTPKLWAFISALENISRVIISVERSLGCLLDIDCPLARGDKRMAPFLDLVLLHVHRWRSFFGMAHALGIHNLAFILQHPTPRLERFSLSHILNELPEGMPISNLFQGQAPSLKWLTTTNLDIPWDSSLPSLEHLYIADHHGETGQWPMRYHQLFSSFRQLRSVCITRGADFIDLKSPLVQLDHVLLPRLEFLSLKGLSVAIITTILSFLLTPSDKSIYINVQSLPFTSRVLTTILSLNKATVLPPLLSQMTHMHLHYGSTRLQVTGYNFTIPNWRAHIPLKPLVLEFKRFYGYLSPSLTTLLFTLLPPSAIRSLCLSGKFLFDNELLGTQLGLLVSLEELTLCTGSGRIEQEPGPSTGADNILRSLSGPPQLCLKLKKLAIDCVNFQEQILLEFVRARCGNTTKQETVEDHPVALETLVLTRDIEGKPFDPIIIEELQSLVNLVLNTSRLIDRY